MQMQRTYWLQKVLKMISLYVNALLCTLQHIVILRIDTAKKHRVYDNMLQRVQSALTYKEIIFSTFSNQ